MRMEGLEVIAFVRWFAQNTTKRPENNSYPLKKKSSVYTPLNAEPRITHSLVYPNF